MPFTYLSVKSLSKIQPVHGLKRLGTFTIHHQDRVFIKPHKYDPAQHHFISAVASAGMLLPVCVILVKLLLCRVSVRYSNALSNKNQINQTKWKSIWYFTHIMNKAHAACASRPYDYFPLLFAAKFTRYLAASLIQSVQANVCSYLEHTRCQNGERCQTVARGNQQSLETAF